jgi:membrane protease YdiL (CAAX protease family)
LPKIREVLAVNRLIKLRDVSHGVIYGLVYYGILLAVMIPLMLAMPEIIGQEQNIGFSQVGNSWWEFALIFLVLVVVAPIAEEVLMRGLLFGRIRSQLSFWPTALIISFVFAVAHWQINVSIDTFILSMVACYAREKTGALYSSILIHAAKNGLAFALLFMM